MQITVTEELLAECLRVIRQASQGTSIRWITAVWLLSDRVNIVDATGNAVIAELVSRKLVQESSGWIHPTTIPFT